MKPSMIPDVLFLRPTSNSALEASGVESDRESASIVAKPMPASDPSLPHVSGNDVVFASVAAEPTVIPTPHTRFSGRRNPDAPPAATTAEENSAEENSAEESSAAGSSAEPSITIEQDSNEAPFVVAPSSPASATMAHPFQLEVEADNQPKTTVDPSWMVDQFRWNSISDQLIEANADDLARLIREIRKPAQSIVVVGIFGLSEGAGTTTVSQICVRMLDESEQSKTKMAFDTPGQPSLLLDANLWNPSIGAQLGLRCRRCWADLQEQRDSLGDAAIADGENRIHVMPLNCSIQLDELELADSLPLKSHTSFSIPATGMSGLVNRLKNVIAHGRTCYSNLVIDLGPIEAWQSRSGLRTLGPLLTNVLLVNRPPIDRRQFSQVYWELTDSGIKNIHVLENPILHAE